MSAVARLIKAKTISFTEELLKNYKKINLNEVETILLIKLSQQLDSHDNVLSINDLVYSMTLKEKIEKIMSEILSDQHECKVTLHFEPKKEKEVA